MDTSKFSPADFFKQRLNLFKAQTLENAASNSLSAQMSKDFKRQNFKQQTKDNYASTRIDNPYLLSPVNPDRFSPRDDIQSNTEGGNKMRGVTSLPKYNYEAVNPVKSKLKILKQASSWTTSGYQNSSVGQSVHVSQSEIKQKKLQPSTLSMLTPTSETSPLKDKIKQRV